MGTSTTTWYRLESVLSILFTSFHIIFKKHPARLQYYLHFMKEEIEALRSAVICLRSLKQQVAVWRSCQCELLSIVSSFSSYITSFKGLLICRIQDIRTNSVLNIILKCKMRCWRTSYLKIMCWAVFFFSSGYSMISSIAVSLVCLKLIQAAFSMNAFIITVVLICNMLPPKYFTFSTGITKIFYLPHCYLLKGWLQNMCLKTG